MANRSNETSRQRRARENRARREALEARKKAAQTPREERVVRTEPAPAADADAGRSRRGGRTAARSGSEGAGSTRQALAQGRLGSTPVDLESLEGSFLGKVVRVPGGMQVIMATALVVVLTIMGAFLETIPPEGAESGADPTRTIFEAYGLGAVMLLAPPVILAVNALVFALNPKRRRMWTISAVMMAVFAVVLLLFQYLFAAGFLGYAAWRSKRIEEGPPMRGRAARDDDDDAPELSDEDV